MTTISFIGAGNMATALISGLINNDYQIIATDEHEDKLKILTQLYQIETTTDNNQAVQQADIVVLAVKPKDIANVTRQIAATAHDRKPLIISIAAGVTTQAIANHLSYNAAIVRCMPNTPALINSGASALYANGQVSEQQKQQAESILRAVGITVWVHHEHQLNTITALSGSGPAYFFLFMEILAKWAQQNGLDKDSAQLLTTQTALGAARLALESNNDPSILRQQVTSPGGTTESALNFLNHSEFESIINKALDSAKQRSEELAKEFD